MEKRAASAIHIWTTHQKWSLFEPVKVASHRNSLVWKYHVINLFFQDVDAEVG